ncbi:MAG: DHHW family protein [Oscillospiraceae bacterium]|nr:DHHW family protein [Oscillospiraceae bacterium]
MKKKKYPKQFIIRVKKYIKLSKSLLPGLFFLCLTLGMLFSLIIPLRPTYSDVEKRELAKFPEFSFTALVSGRYFKDIDTWFADTFPFREGLITVNSKLSELRGVGDRIYGLNDMAVQTVPEVTSGKEPENTGEEETSATTEKQTEPTVPDQINDVTQTLGGVLVIGDSGYEYCSFHQNVADKYAGIINKTAKELKGISSVYCMVVPTSMDITISDNVRKGINSCDQSEVAKYIYDSLNTGAKTVDLYTQLRMHRDEYVYFRTDHHWTALGAYYAYEKFCETAGYKPITLDKYKKVSYGDFLGSFYGDTNNSAMRKNPDELIAYLPPYKSSLTFTNPEGKSFNWDLVHDVSNYPISQKYNSFAGSDNPFTVIENLSKEKGKTCLVIKESFGNAMIPFLVGKYKKVYVIDYRYYKKGIIAFAKQNKINDVLFINNASAVRSDTLIERMRLIAN